MSMYDNQFKNRGKILYWEAVERISDPLNSQKIANVAAIIPKSVKLDMKDPRFMDLLEHQY